MLNRKHPANALAHLARRFIGEGDGENLVRRYPFADEMVDARREHTRFTTPGASEYRDRSLDREDRSPLRVIQSFEVFHLSNIPYKALSTGVLEAD